MLVFLVPPTGCHLPIGAETDPRQKKSEQSVPFGYQMLVVWLSGYHVGLHQCTLLYAKPAYNWDETTWIQLPVAEVYLNM